jgi:hypothetical protein
MSPPGYPCIPKGFSQNMPNPGAIKSTDNAARRNGTSPGTNQVGSSRERGRNGDKGQGNSSGHNILGNDRTRLAKVGTRIKDINFAEDNSRKRIRRRASVGDNRTEAPRCRKGAIMREARKKRAGTTRHGVERRRQSLLQGDRKGLCVPIHDRCTCQHDIATRGDA